MTHSMSLSQMGWRSFFQQQLSFEELEDTLITRVVEHHRSEFQLITEQGIIALADYSIHASNDCGRLAVAG